MEVKDSFSEEETGAHERTEVLSLGVQQEHSAERRGRADTGMSWGVDTAGQSGKGWL